VIQRNLWIGSVAALVLAIGGVAWSAETFQLMKVGRVYLDDVIPGLGEEHIVELYLRAETVIGEPLHQLGPSDLSIRDNGEIADPSRVRLQLLSEAGVGISAVLVIDTSRTMGGESFDRAKAAALRFLQRMGDFDHVAVVSFDDDVQVAAAFGAPRTETRIALEQLEVQPKTLSKLVWDGAGKSIELLRKRPANLPRRSFVILFSDGRDSSSGHSLAEVIDAAQGEPGEGRIPIFTIGYSRFGGTGLDSLDELSRGSGASSFQAEKPAELERFFDEIWKRMTQSFVIRYPADMDGMRHTIEVTIDDHSDSREVVFPEIKPLIWPWVGGAGVLLTIGAGVWFFARSRSAGRLIFEGGARSGQSVTLTGKKLRVGALEENDLVLNFPTISRYHAQLHLRGSKVEVEDLGSKNGTLINGTLIRTRSELSPGDRLRFGDVEMLYRR
jgi:Mg-chelatase subunit ChlD